MDIESILEEFIGKRVTFDIEEFDECEEFDYEAYGEEEDDLSGGGLLIGYIEDEEIDEIEGSLHLGVSFSLDYEGCLCELEPVAEFYYRGGIGDPAVDPDEYWNDSATEKIVTALKTLTETE